MEEKWAEMHWVGFQLDDRLDSRVESLTLIDEIIIGIDLKLEIGVRILNVYTPWQGIPAAEKKVILSISIRWHIRSKVPTEYYSVWWMKWTHIGSDKKLWAMSIS